MRPNTNTRHARASLNGSHVAAKLLKLIRNTRPMNRSAIGSSPTWRAIASRSRVSALIPAPVESPVSRPPRGRPIEMPRSSRMWVPSSASATGAPSTCTSRPEVSARAITARTLETIAVRSAPETIPARIAADRPSRAMSVPDKRPMSSISWRSRSMSAGVRGSGSRSSLRLSVPGRKRSLGSVARLRTLAESSPGSSISARVRCAISSSVPGSKMPSSWRERTRTTSGSGTPNSRRTSSSMRTASAPVGISAWPSVRRCSRSIPGATASVTTSASHSTRRGRRIAKSWRRFNARRQPEREPPGAGVVPPSGCGGRYPLRAMRVPLATWSSRAMAWTPVASHQRL